MKKESAGSHFTGREKSENNGFKFELKDEIGVFRVVEGDNQLSINLENSSGQQFKVNSLLLPGYEFVSKEILQRQGEEVDEDRETYVRHGKKQVVIDTVELRKEEWQYLLSILHEIGHLARQKEKSKDVKRLDQLTEKQPAIWQDPELFAEMLKLQSEDERDSWAFAIRQLRKMAREFNPELKKVFPDLKSFRDYVDGNLVSGYKKPYREIINSGLTGEYRKELLDALEDLYTRGD